MSRRRREIGECTRIEELRAAGARGIDYQQLMTADCDLVPMQQRSRIGSQANAIDPYLRFPVCRPDGGSAGRHSLHHGVSRPHPFAFQDHFAVRSRTYDCLAGGDGVPLAVDFEMDH
jgi:hypothetical protein